MYSVVLFGFIVHIKYFKLRIFSLYVDLKLIYFVFGDFDWIFVLAFVTRMTMGDRMVYPPDTLNRFIPSGGINSYIPPDSLRTDTLFRDTGVHSQLPVPPSGTLYLLMLRNSRDCRSKLKTYLFQSIHGS